MTAWSHRLSTSILLLYALIVSTTWERQGVIVWVVVRHGYTVPVREIILLLLCITYACSTAAFALRLARIMYVHICETTSNRRLLHPRKFAFGWVRAFVSAFHSSSYIHTQPNTSPFHLCKPWPSRWRVIDIHKTERTKTCSRGSFPPFTHSMLSSPLHDTIRLLYSRYV